VLLPFLFQLITDEVTRQSIDNKGTGIQWISRRNFKDLKYADDMTLLSHSFNCIQKAT